MRWRNLGPPICLVPLLLIDDLYPNLEFPDVLLDKGIKADLLPSSRLKDERPEYLDLLRKLQTCSPDSEGILEADILSVLQRFSVGWDESQWSTFAQDLITRGFLVRLDTGAYLVRSPPRVQRCNLR